MTATENSTMTEELNTATLLQQFNLSDHDMQLIRKFSESTELDSTKLVDDFYTWLTGETWFNTFFPTGVINRVKDLQSDYWAEFLRAQVDDDYVSGRIDLGNIHAKINLPVTAYIAGMNFCQAWLDRALQDSSLAEEEHQETRSAIARLIQIDTAIVMHAYAMRSTQRLQESQLLQTAVMNASLAPMLTIDGAGTIQFVSASIEQNFGWRPDEVVGKNIKMLMPDPYQSQHDGYLDTYRKTGKTGIIGVPRTLRAVRKNGEEFDCQISVSKVDTGDTTAPLFTGVIQDVTDRVTFENRVEEINGILQAVANGDISQKITVDGEEDKLGQAVFSVVESFEEIVSQANNISVGNFDIELHPRSENDQIRQALINMTDTLRDVTSQANNIAQGNYDAEVTPRSDKDELGKALFNMTDTLRKSDQRNRRDSWFKTGQAELGDHMRGELDLPTLCKNVITYLCKYLGAQVGIFYLLDDDEALRMNASYAFTRRKGLANEIKLGEGLVGQAALEKESIVISDVPEDYIAINSGLGEAVPHNMLVVPVLEAGTLMGILEVGSFQPFSDDQIQLLQLVNENIAIAIKSSRDGDKMRDLLEESQRSSEELQSQQEELKAANEEMEEQTQALKSSEQVLKAQSAELQQSNEELEEKSKFLERQKAEIEKQNSAIETSRQELMTKADELALSSKYKSEFLANMSHELRTPLNSLLILSKSLADNRPGNLTEDQVESAQTVYSGGQELLELINDILDLSKVEAGKLSVHIESIALEDLKQDLSRKFKPLTDDKSLALELDTGSGLPETFLGDNQRTQQILKNLLSNAIKFTSEGSVKIKFHSPASDTRFTHSSLSHDSAIGISVTDTGIGIPEDKQQAIFEAFQQADGSTSRQFGGTGLGLAISRELSRLLGGEIQLHSEPGVGSTFTLYLPLDAQTIVDSPEIAVGSDLTAVNQPLQTPQVKPQVPIVTKAGAAETTFLPDDRHRIDSTDKSLLIIEDDRNFAKILLKLAHDKGFKCLCAGDGSSGLHLAQKYLPDGIILDLGLPDIDGLAVLEHLKHDLNTRHIPVHIMSASDARTASLQAGALDFMSKPVTEENLALSLQKIEQIVPDAVKKLLVVEDNDTNRKAIVKLLENKQITITDVADGQSTLEALQTETFDCIILDLELPDMSGFELLQQLEKQKERHLPPVIIHTGRELNADEHKELQQYADSIVIKGASSPERLLDEASLFLHSMASSMPKEQQAMIQMMHQPDQALSGKLILLVDDDVRNTFAMSKELREHDMQVILADNGQMALEQLQQNPGIAMVLMDIMMPVMDGHEAMQKIRQQAKYKDLPIIALTALAMAEDKTKCIDSGANDYLSKPVDVDKLLSMMRIWLFSNSEQERRGQGRPWEDDGNNGQSTDDDERRSKNNDQTDDEHDARDLGTHLEG